MTARAAVPDGAQIAPATSEDEEPAARATVSVAIEAPLWEAIGELSGAADAEAFINDVLRLSLQRRHLLALEARFGEESGPLADEDWRWARQSSWPQ